MINYIFKCKECNTKMTIETNLDPKNVHTVPPCLCGKSRMEWTSASKLEEQAPLMTKCYFCQGTGLLQSDEECFCVTNSCACKYCKTDKYAGGYWYRPKE